MQPGNNPFPANGSTPSELIASALLSEAGLHSLLTSVTGGSATREAFAKPLILSSWTP